VRRRTHTSCTMSAALLTNVDQKLLRKTKFPPEFDQKVNMEKVNVPVIKKWVADEVARILNNDDDIVTELIYNVLEESPYVGGLGYMSQGLS
jgi:serine/arginine repetitive matrix protein 1